MFKGRAGIRIKSQAKIDAANMLSFLPSKAAEERGLWRSVQAEESTQNATKKAR